MRRRLRALAIIESNRQSAEIEIGDTSITSLHAIGGTPRSGKWHAARRRAWKIEQVEPDLHIARSDHCQ
jgi:hypothetical protein